MSDQQRGFANLYGADRGERNLTTCRGGRWQVDRRQGVETLMILLVDFQNDPILVRLREDRRDDALSEGIVKRIVHRRRRDAEARCGRPVDFDVCCQSVILMIARDIGDLGDLAQSGNEARNPFGKFRQVRILEHELVLGRADIRVDGQVLDRRHKNRNARDFAGFLLDAIDNLARRQLSLIVGAQVDKHAPGIQRYIAAIDTDERGQSNDIGIFQDCCGQLTLVIRHAAIRNGLACRCRCLDQARVLNREEALRNDDVEIGGQGKRGGENRHGRIFSVQHPVEAPAIGGQRACQKFRHASAFVLRLSLHMTLHEQRTHHRNQRERDHHQ